MRSNFLRLKFKIYMKEQHKNNAGRDRASMQPIRFHRATLLNGEWRMESGELAGAFEF
jgi:hypothetical protein